MSGFPYTFPFFFHVDDTFRRQYRLAVRNPDGDLVRFIGQSLGTTTKDTLNAASILTTVVPIEDVAADSLVGGNEIWVEDQDETVQPGQKYIIEDRQNRNGQRGPTIAIRAASYLSRLTDEWVGLTADYDVSTRTVADIVDDWIALQVGPFQIASANISAVFTGETRTLLIDRPQTFLQALLTLEKTIDERTHFWIDNSNVLQWIALSDLADAGKQWRTGKNLKSLSQLSQHSQQVTRLYVFGGHVDGERIHLSEADGQAEDYIEPADGLNRYKYIKRIVIPWQAIDPTGEASYLFREDADSDLAANGGDGTDIKFLSDDQKTVLTHSLDAFDGATGEITANITHTISGTKDTIIFMIYGLYSP